MQIRKTKSVWEGMLREWRGRVGGRMGMAIIEIHCIYEILKNKNILKTQAHTHTHGKKCPNKHSWVR